MNITKIPGFGRFGIFIDDIDLDSISNSQWMEIGILQTRFLLVILRNVKATEYEKFQQLICRWGGNYSFKQKPLADYYGVDRKNLPSILDIDSINGKLVDAREKNLLKFLIDSTIPFDRIDIKNSDFFCKPLRIDSTNLNTHSKFYEPGVSISSLPGPASALLGVSGMPGTTSRFLQTVDWYESQTQSFQSELDDIIIIHNCQSLNIETPLVINTLGGDKGIHFSTSDGLSVKGMSDRDSKSFFDHVSSTLIDKRYVYDHIYSQDTDLILMDNSACFHGWDTINQSMLVYAAHHDFSILLPEYNPWNIEPYKANYRTGLSDLI
jgi:hypothetical protein